MTGPLRTLAHPWRALTRRLAARRHHGVTPARTWRATELAEMTPNERQAIIRSGLVTDPDKVPSDVIARLRRKADAHISASEDPGDPG